MKFPASESAPPRQESCTDQVTLHMEKETGSMPKSHLWTPPPNLLLSNVNLRIPPENLGINY